MKVHRVLILMLMALLLLVNLVEVELNLTVIPALSQVPLMNRQKNPLV
jgi:hypothetical protein